MTHVGAYLVGSQRVDPQQICDCDLKRDLRGRNLLQRLGIAAHETFGLVRAHLGAERRSKVLAPLCVRHCPGQDLCRYLRVSGRAGHLVPLLCQLW